MRAPRFATGLRFAEALRSGEGGDFRRAVPPAEALRLFGGAAARLAEVGDFCALRSWLRWGVAGGYAVGALDLVVDFGAVYWDRPRRFDPQLHGIAIDRDDDDSDVVTDHDRLIELSAED
jgi:hypothetical protein